MTIKIEPTPAPTKEGILLTNHHLITKKAQ
jgi:hypothetical protein